MHVPAGRIIAITLCLATPGIALAAAPPECSPEQIAGLPTAASASYESVGYDNGSVARAFARLVAKNRGYDDQLHGIVTGLEIDYPFDSMKRYGARAKFVVGVDGRVSCASLAPLLDGDPQPQWTPERREWAESMPQWRFTPYLSNGKPVAVVAETSVSEYELPKAHIPMPAGDPKQVVIIQDMPIFGYRIELHGNGDAIFSSTRPDYVLGPQPYHVDPGNVAYILQKAKEADFWSLRDVYPPNQENPGSYTSRIQITLGGVTKSLTQYDGDQESGMPQDGYFLALGIRHDIDIEFWRLPSIKTIAQLKTNGFDFHSEAAGHFLLQIMGTQEVSDEVVAEVMALGAPQDAVGQAGHNEEPRNLLEAALSARRTGIARNLIDQGGLKTSGQLDQVKVDRAFLAALDSGNLSTVDLILPFKPAMTYPDPQDKTVSISVLFRFSDDIVDRPDAFLLLQRLLDLGIDINARAANGETLLHRLHGSWTQQAIAFLLDHGADINAVDARGITPLVSGISEDKALYLLVRGADPRIGKTPQALCARIEGGGWPRVKLWLLAHGYTDVLAAPETTKH